MLVPRSSDVIYTNRVISLFVKIGLDPLNMKSFRRAERLTAFFRFLRVYPFKGWT